MRELPRQTANGPIDRRQFLWETGGGLGGIALASLLAGDRVLAAGTAAQTRPRGAASCCIIRPRPNAWCSFSWRAGPAMSTRSITSRSSSRRNGQKWDPGEKVELFQDGLGATFCSPWKWARYGECGKPLSEIVAPLGACVDEMAFIHSMVGKTGVHSQGTYLQATGFDTPGFPGAGAWVSYALGSANENLPTFVVLPDHRGFASNGPKNWGAGFLPAEHQGTILRPGTPNPIADLHPPAGHDSPALRDRTIRLLGELNREHLATRPGDSRLEARIRSYELAARMQLSAPEALDISGEPKHVLAMYGLDDPPATFPAEINAQEETVYFGRKCLVARRLLERGVRFVQIWSGCDNGFPRRNWDSHEDIARDHGPMALGMARATAALILDLKQRGLLDDTLIHWTTEFGRMPCAQGGKGRDHNPFGFTNWLAGGGIRGGTTFGPSDEWGYKPADRDRPTTCHDVHATMLHLLGIDHERLTVRHNGIDRRLTDVSGNVIHDILA